MKALILAAFVVLVSSNVYLEGNELNSIGHVCQSDGGFTISNFTVSPFPPTGCSPQAVSVTGTFTIAACPNQIHINENYNQRQSYNQDINLSGTCYTAGQVETINFNVNPYQCAKGSYQIQISLNQQTPQRRLACWEYSYTI